MSAKPEVDWEFLGWKVWYRVAGTTTVYSSKTHVWEDLPEQGVQLLFRYYRKGSKRWREKISGDDFYVSEYSVLADLVRSNTLLKVSGTDTDSTAYRNSVSTAEADTSDGRELDMSLESYTKPRKTLLGWKALYSDREYSKNWSTLPDQGINFLVRYWSDGTREWKEFVGAKDLYTLNPDDELSIVQNDTRIKLGSVVTEQELSDIYQEALSDEEEF